MKEVTCPGCQHRDQVIAALQHQVADLQARVQDLEARLGQNASTSSIPPSANPPTAPKPVTKKPTGRPPGGQPGHPGHRRHRLPPEQVRAVIPHMPTTCARCQGPLPPTAGPDDPEPTWHQVIDLPEIAAFAIEHQGHARTCPGCGEITWAPIPEAVRAHSIGPKLAATMAYFSGCHHISKRGVEEIVETVFAAPMSLGTVGTVEREVSHALGPAYAEAAVVVQQAPVKNVDETGWKQAGQRCWLWAAATATVAYFRIHARRSREGLKALLGEVIAGIVGSDRWGAYTLVAVSCRQLCWAHLKRDFQKCLDRGGAAHATGAGGLAAVQKVFDRWYAFRGGGLDRRGLQAGLEPIGRELHEVLIAGSGCADAKAATFCRNLLALEPALWTFAAVEGVEPTNNHIERLLRRGVLWRKNAFGCQSAEGCQFVERILTVAQTLRLQNRQVLDYLHPAIAAHRAGQPAPRLVPSV